MSQYRQSPFANLTPVVKNLLIINVIFFVATYVLHNTFDMDKWLAVYYFNSPFFKPWQIVTYMFMHGGIGHIFFNMFTLFMFGPILEYAMGPKRFLNFYFICGIGAILLQFLVQAIEVYHITGGITIAHPELDASYYQFGPSAEKLGEIYFARTVGASGALFGVVVAFALLYPNLELMIMFIPVPIKAKYLVSVYVLYTIYQTIRPTAGDNVAHLVHLGGGLLGLIMIKIWGMKRTDNFF